MATGKAVEWFMTTPRGPSENPIGGIASRVSAPAVIGRSLYFPFSTVMSLIRSQSELSPDICSTFCCSVISAEELPGVALHLVAGQSTRPRGMSVNLNVPAPASRTKEPLTGRFGWVHQRRKAARATRTRRRAPRALRIFLRMRIERLLSGRPPGRSSRVAEEAG